MFRKKSKISGNVEISLYEIHCFSAFMCTFLVTQHSFDEFCKTNQVKNKLFEYIGERFFISTYSFFGN